MDTLTAVARVGTAAESLREAAARGARPGRGGGRRGRPDSAERQVGGPSGGQSEGRNRADGELSDGGEAENAAGQLEERLDGSALPAHEAGVLDRFEPRTKRVIVAA